MILSILYWYLKSQFLIFFIFYSLFIYINFNFCDWFRAKKQRLLGEKKKSGSVTAKSKMDDR